MIVDTSALVAILKNEPQQPVLLAALVADPHVKLSAATLFEFGMVMDKVRNPGMSAAVDRLLYQIEAEILPVTTETASACRDAYRRFGKGNHPARLNFGDCFAYALAKELDEPLLFKGTDFAQTDVRSAL